MGDDDVVEGRMTLAEARKTDFENHGEDGLGVLFLVVLRRLPVAAAKDDDFRDEGTNAKNSHSPMVATINSHFTFASHCFHYHSACHFHLLPFTSNLLRRMINTWAR